MIQRTTIRGSEILSAVGNGLGRIETRKQTKKRRGDVSRTCPLARLGAGGGQGRERSW